MPCGSATGEQTPSCASIPKPRASNPFLYPDSYASVRQLDPTHALFSGQSQSIRDNVMAYWAAAASLWGRTSGRLIHAFHGTRTTRWCAKGRDRHTSWTPPLFNRGQSPVAPRWVTVIKKRECARAYSKRGYAVVAVSWLALSRVHRHAMVRPHWARGSLEPDSGILATVAYGALRMSG